MELRLPQMLLLYDVFLENKNFDNCAQLLEKEFNKMFNVRPLNDEHVCNVVSMNSLNIHDANDMQSHKLGDAMFDEDDLFSFPSFDEQIYYDDCMPPIYDDYNDESGFGRVSTLCNNDFTILEKVSIDYDNKVAIYDDYCDDMYAIKNNDNYETCHHDFNFQLDYANQVSHDSYFVEFAPTIIDENKFAYVESNKISMLVGHEKNALCDRYIVEFIHDATENYYERGSYAYIYFNNIKFPFFVLKLLKLYLFYLPMLVDSCSHKLFARKIPMHRKLVRLKCACHMIHDARFVFQFFTFMRASSKSSCLTKRH